MQHGQAASEVEDPARPLTETGREAVTRVANRAHAAGLTVDLVVHSGKRRAEQTAELLSVAVSAGRLEARDGLSPNSPVEPVAAWLEGLDVSSVAVVGHLPFLDRLASLLVAGDESAQPVRFSNGGLVKLEPRSTARGFCLAWAITPAVA